MSAPVHLALPLRVSASGSLATQRVGSPAEVGQSVALLLATRVGERRSEPEYGSGDALFGPLGSDRLDEAAIETWEPRAVEELGDDQVLEVLEGTDAAEEVPT